MARARAPRQHVRDDGSDRRYFTMVPHLVMDRLIDGQISTLAFALYAYYRRRCGEHGDEYAESIRSTARGLGKSVGAVYAARIELVDSGLIDLHLEGPEGHETARIAIRDIWAENVARQQAKGETSEMRSNGERKPRRKARFASGSRRTQSVELPDASVQIVNAPIPTVKEPEKNLKNQEEPGGSARAGAREAQPSNVRLFETEPCPKPVRTPSRYDQVLELVRARAPDCVIGGSRQRNETAINDSPAAIEKIVDAYLALMDGRWSDSFVRKLGSLHAVVENLGGYELTVARGGAGPPRGRVSERALSELSAGRRLRVPT